jgi:hypothetical protein
MERVGVAWFPRVPGYSGGTASAFDRLPASCVVRVVVAELAVRKRRRIEEDVRAIPSARRAVKHGVLRDEVDGRPEETKRD